MRGIVGRVTDPAHSINHPVWFDHNGLLALYSSPVKTTYTITEAQAKLPQIVRETADGSIYTVTRHGEAAAFIISARRFLAIVETLEIMGNPEAMKAIAEDRAGKTKYLPIEALDDL